MVKKNCVAEKYINIYKLFQYYKINKNKINYKI